MVYEPESLSLRVTDFDRSTERRFGFIENRHAPKGQLYVSPRRSPGNVRRCEIRAPTGRPLMAYFLDLGPPRWGSGDFGNRDSQGCALG